MTIDVYIDAYGEKWKAGILRRHAGSGRERVTYQHSEEWLNSPTAFQFDPTLPLRRGTLHPGAGKAMFGTLGDSAPDTWGRNLMRRRERRDAEREGRPPRTLHEIDYLLGVSDETRLGGVRFAVADIFQSPQSKGVPTLIALGDLLEAAQRIEYGEETDDDLMMIFAPGSSLGGARPKASVCDHYGNLSIAKFPKDSDKYSIERWEAITMDMAKAAGIQAADHQLVPAAGKTAFLSRRFDRLAVGASSQRIPFMSAMAATGHNDGDDTCSYLELLDIISERGAEPKSDRAELFRRIAFTILVQNIDDHFRNHGFLWTGRKGWRLSPAYDLNPNPYGAGILSTRISFDDATASIALLRSVAELFVSLAEADAIVDDCKKVVRTWRDFARNRSAPASEVKQMEAVFERAEVVS